MNVCEVLQYSDLVGTADSVPCLQLAQNGLYDLSRSQDIQPVAICGAFDWAGFQVLASKIQEAEQTNDFILSLDVVRLNEGVEITREAVVQMIERGTSSLSRLVTPTAKLVLEMEIVGEVACSQSIGNVLPRANVVRRVITNMVFGPFKGLVEGVKGATVQLHAAERDGAVTFTGTKLDQCAVTVKGAVAFIYAVATATASATTA